MLKQFGGAPVASDRFAGWWGNDVWFVDFDNGVRTSQKGKNDIENPQKDLYQAITDSGAGDVIYIRPRTTVGDRGTSATSITPASTEAVNWTIPLANPHMSIIGTGSPNALEKGVKLQAYAASTSPTITVLAPYVTFENVGFNGISTQTDFGILYANSEDLTTDNGYACTVNNCTFHVYPVQAGGAVFFESCRYGQVINSSFWHNVISIYLGSAGRVCQGTIIQNCDFHGATTDVDADIYSGDVNHFTIDNCRFHHGQPAKDGGVYKYYIINNGSSAGTGMVSNCTFGTTEGTMDAVACVLNGLLDVANKCGGTLLANDVFMHST
jgi:hypothetical protein